MNEQSQASATQELMRKRSESLKQKIETISESNVDKFENTVGWNNILELAGGMSEYDRALFFNDLVGQSINSSTDAEKAAAQRKIDIAIEAFRVVNQRKPSKTSQN